MPTKTAAKSATKPAPAATAPEVPDFPAGTPLTVTIIKRPTRRAALITLQHVLASRDADLKRSSKRDYATRPSRSKIKTRGGREWVGAPKKSPLITGEVGETATIKADHAALVALRSVSRFVQIKKA